METLGLLLRYLIGFYMLVVLARVLLDWIPPVDSSALRSATLWAHRLTEPLLGPLRRVVPLLPLGGGAALDLSPTVLLLLLLVLQLLVGKLLG